MTVESIERDFRDKVSAQIRLAAEGVDRFRVMTPFLFDDGDHLAIVLKREGPRWVLTDEAHTYMHLTYDLDERDLHTGTRQKIISNALALFRVEDRDGELVLDVPDSCYGDALYSFVQALLRISDVSYLSRERVGSTFMEDFRALLGETLPEERGVSVERSSARSPRHVRGRLPGERHAVRARARQRRPDARCHDRAVAVREVGGSRSNPCYFRGSGIDQPQGPRSFRRMREAVLQSCCEPGAHQALLEQGDLGMKCRRGDPDG